MNTTLLSALNLYLERQQVEVERITEDLTYQVQEIKGHTLRTSRSSSYLELKEGEVAGIMKVMQAFAERPQEDPIYLISIYRDAGVPNTGRNDAYNKGYELAIRTCLMIAEVIG